MHLVQLTRSPKIEQLWALGAPMLPCKSHRLPGALGKPSIENVRKYFFSRIRDPVRANGWAFPCAFAALLTWAVLGLCAPFLAAVRLIPQGPAAGPCNSDQVGPSGRAHTLESTLRRPVVELRSNYGVLGPNA